MKWYLDFGHGGKDSGSVGSNGKKEEDKFYSLSYRTTKANNENCDYFVSIHMNSSENKSAKGTETWIYDTNNKICKLATNLSSNLSNKLNTPNRGVKVSKKFSVLKHSKMPTVIIEIDFISNNSVEASCSDEMYIRNAANTIASTLLEFVSKKIENEGPFYRVFIGAFNIKDNAVKLRNEAISKGFKDTYITT